MRILHIINKYGNLTGSEMYVYELTREQAKKHNVYIYTRHLKKGVLLNKTKNNKVTVFTSFNNFPEIDIVHCHQSSATEFALSNFNNPVVQTVHSEVIPKYEYPVKGAKFIAIRPQIKEYIKKSGFGSEMILNPFNTSRFTKSIKVESNPPKVLFIGTVDYLRSKSIKYLLKEHIKNKIELIGVGIGWDKIPIKSYHPMFNVEKLLEKVDYTAGVQLGRSSIEGWLCGKPAIIFDIDSTGHINDIKIMEVPDDLSIFDSAKIAEKVETFYDRCLHPIMG